jgi:hypothetical protein
LADSSPHRDAQRKSEETFRPHRETSKEMQLQEAQPIVIVHKRIGTNTLRKIAFEELHDLWPSSSPLGISTIEIHSRRQRLASEEPGTLDLANACHHLAAMSSGRNQKHPGSGPGEWHC